MKPSTPLQSIIDPFVKGIGGELISELVGNNTPPSSADYLFRRYNVIAELKTLQVDSFGDPLCRKLGARMGDWLTNSRLLPYGTTRFDSKRLSPESQNEMFDVIAAPLKNHVVYSASKQIESTKEVLSMPDAKGLLWVASDGNEALQPDAVWFLLKRILQKRHENGALCYSNIHGLAYFNPRMLVEMPQSKRPALIWFSGPRQPEDQQMGACLSELCVAWPQYVSWAQGVPVRPMDAKTVSPDGLRFLGVPRRMPRIQVGDPFRHVPR
jgi:hypothetical protein